MFYTYLWLREDGTPYYVGKGTRSRAFTSRGHRVHVPPKERIVIYPADSEIDAFETETALIWYYGRKDLGKGTLRNLTDGGQGMSGRKFTDVTRHKISEAHRGMKVSEEARNKIRATKIGSKHSEQTRSKMSKAKMGNKNSPGWPKGKPRKVKEGSECFIN
jgi:hypothetical protein